MAGAPQALTARGALAVAAASAAFATSAPLVRYALAEASPLVIAAARCLLAAAAIAALRRGAIPRAFAALDARQRRIVVGAGLVLAGHAAGFTIGLGATSFAAAVTLVSLEPVAVLIAAFLFFGVVPTRLERAGVALAAVGALVVARSGEGASG